MKGLAAIMILLLLIAGHQPPAAVNPIRALQADTGVAIVPQATIIPLPDTLASEISKEEPSIQTGTLNPVSLVDYAKTLVGTPYLYGSIDPRRGFDCSGFITYVFNHFNIKVPRSSVEFTRVGADVNYLASKPGDLILFTGTDSTIRVVGHMGIIVSNENNQVYFIHSSSGKQYGVIVTELNPYYLSRFVRIARVFPDKADLNPMVRTNRLIVVDSVHQVSKMKTIKLNQLD
jgi:cell wall-associated NlpC family hydrolase